MRQSNKWLTEIDLWLIHNKQYETNGAQEQKMVDWGSIRSILTELNGSNWTLAKCNESKTLEHHLRESLLGKQRKRRRKSRKTNNHGLLDITLNEVIARWSAILTNYQFPRSVSACFHMEPNKRSKPRNRAGPCRRMQQNECPPVCCEKGADKNALPPDVTETHFGLYCISKTPVAKTAESKTISKRFTSSFVSAICKLPSTNHDAATYGSWTRTLYHTKYEEYVFFVLFSKNKKLGGCVCEDLLSTIQRIGVQVRCS